MFQNLKIISLINKVTSTDKPYKALEVQDEAGAVFKVNIFSDFPEFALLQIGSVVRGQLVQKGQYTNLLSETQNKPRGGAPGAFKTAQVKEVMDIKRQDIQKSQENKEISIKIASTIRMAVDIATSLTIDEREGTMQETIRFWREWLWLEWDNLKDALPF